MNVVGWVITGITVVAIIHFDTIIWGKGEGFLLKGFNNGLVETRVYVLYTLGLYLSL